MSVSGSSTTATATANATAPAADAESQHHTAPKNVSYIRHLTDQAGVTQAVLDHPYVGSGTPESPFQVEFLPKGQDPYDPMSFSSSRKWFITAVQAVATLSVAFASSAFSGGVGDLIVDMGVSSELAILGVSLYVLGFAIGPVVWAPLSEMYGRQVTFFFSYMAMTAFNAGAAGAQTIAGVVVLRFFAGAFGASPLTNAGGVIADMFTAEQRGLATSVFALAPFLGPALGPIAGGFLGEAAGWRWVQGMITIFNGALWIFSTFAYPETYPPVLLKRRADALSRITGKTYISKLEVGKPPKTIGAQFRTALSRPWILLFKEPIVLVTSVYMAILYGTLYLCFAAFPIVFQQGRGWSPGIGGLAFIGLAVGMGTMTMASLLDNKRYARVSAAHGGAAPPEARLPPTLIGCILIPVGMFWFAWTNGPEIHWAVPIVGSGFFGAGMVLVFLSIMNYLVDTYVIFAASVLAANSILRSLLGAVFPLFTTYMYKDLGIHWASSIPAFLALACVPFPFIFYKYGERIRMRCEYSAEAAKVLERMRTKHVQPNEDEAMLEITTTREQRRQSLAAQHSKGQ